MVMIMPNHFKCLLCHSGSLISFLKRKNVPVHQHLLCPTFESAKNIVFGNLDLYFCNNCSFIFNNDFNPSLLNYGHNYENSQFHSDLFNDYIESLVNNLISENKIDNCNIVEIGCGKGNFLRKLISKSSNRGFGFDISYVGGMEELEGRLRFYNDYFSDKYSEINPDAIICRHVIEHIQNPLEFIFEIKNILKEQNSVQLFFETPCIEGILENKAYFDFFYEHCSYFSTFSLAFLFEKAGFEVKNIKKVFGNQYLWLEGKSSDKFLTKNLFPKLDSKIIEKFNNSQKGFYHFWKNKLIALKQKGNIGLWGAGAKGVTFANMFDPDCNFFNAIIDINPNKQGKFIPGTGHQIISFEDINKFAIKSLIITNPNYLEEIKKIIFEYNYQIELVNIMECENENNHRY